MNNKTTKCLTRFAGLASLLLIAGTLHAATTVNLTARHSAAMLPDGASVPMWQFCGGLDATSTAGATSGGDCGASGWAPGPTIIVPSIDPSLTIKLTNNLPVQT